MKYPPKFRFYSKKYERCKKKKGGKEKRKKRDKKRREKVENRSNESPKTMNTSNKGLLLKTMQWENDNLLPLFVCLPPLPPNFLLLLQQNCESHFHLGRKFHSIPSHLVKGEEMFVIGIKTQRKIRKGNLNFLKPAVRVRFGTKDILLF